VVGRTRHLSLFQIMQVTTSASLASIKAFPNPLRPALGHASMTFASLPPAAKIKIYTLLGELVQELTANAAGMASWDGLNKSGQKAGSGVYFVVAQSGGDTRSVKVAIQR
jgi:hypothetical protein